MTMRKMAKIAFAEPFRPFRILMNDDLVWHVHYPDMIALGKTKVQLWTWMSEVEQKAKTQELALLMHHMTEVQFLD